MRAEAAAARAFAENPAHSYELDTVELDKMRAELKVLHAAEAAAPAATYTPPASATDHLDAAHRHAVTAITRGPHSLQLLHLHPGADKDAALHAIAATAHHHGQRLVALPARTAGEDHSYADTTADLATAQTHFDDGSWTLPRGTLLVVDDADTLTHDQLHRIAATAAAANAKTILITSDPAHTEPPSTAVLGTYLPHAQHLGTATPHHAAPATALQRAEQHLAASRGFEARYADAQHLIGQRDRILDRLRDTLNAAAELHSHTSVDREHERSQDRGLEL